MQYQAKHKKKQKPLPTFESGIISESLLSFGGHHEHIDPKTGLTLYGPYTPLDQLKPPLSSIKIGIIGTPIMIADTHHFLKSCQNRLENDGNQPFLYPQFPGFNTSFPFYCELLFGETWQEIILEKDISKALSPTNFFARINNIVELYKDKIEILYQRDTQPDVITLCIPQEIINHCTTYLTKAREEKRVKISKRERIARKSYLAGERFLFPEMDPFLGIEGEEFGHQNLRRGLKAQAMSYGIPTQIVWPRTLQLVVSDFGKSSARPVQDIATRAWNFTTALYQKAGATPWRLSRVDPTDCFVGISFYREIREDNPRLRTSLAQTFTAAGDGYVLRGKTFEWDRPDKSPHLDESSATDLIKDVIELYKRHNRGSLPRRIVIHKSSRFWEEELRGFQEGCKLILRKDFISFGSRGIQFYRGGDYPALRGTFVKLTNSNFLLYTSGYVPFLRSYPGSRVPMPLEILEHFGDNPWNMVLKEILALTRLNWNTADFGCHEPITIAFANRVGQILAEVPEDIEPRAEYRYYM